MFYSGERDEEYVDGGKRCVVWNIIWFCVWIIRCNRFLKSIYNRISLKIERHNITRAPELILIDADRVINHLYILYILFLLSLCTQKQTLSTLRELKSLDIIGDRQINIIRHQTNFWDLCCVREALKRFVNF